MKRKRYGIRRNVALLTIIPLLVMAFSLGSFFLHDRFSGMNRDLVTRGQLIARQLAASCEYGVFSNNRAFLAAVTKSALQEADVEAVMVLNAAAEVMEISGEMKARGYSLHRSVNQDTRMLDTGKDLLLYEPIISTQIALEDTENGRAPQQIGAVIIAMSWQWTNRLKSRLLWLTVSATTVFLLVTLFLVYLASRRITEPIRDLSRAVDAIGKGELNTQVQVSEKISELSNLGDGINHMATELLHEHEILQQRIDKATEQLRGSELLFRTLAKIAPVGIYRTNLAEEYLYVNQRWCDITGRTVATSIGTRWIECIHPDDRSRVLDAWLRTSREGLPFKAEYRFLRPDGKSVWVYGLGQAERTQTGEITGFVGTTTDIAELKALQESLEQQVLDRTSQLRDLTMKLTMTEERERQVIAQELHDGLCQILALIKLKLSIFEPCHDGCAWQDDLRMRISAIAELVDQVDQTARNLSLRLSPSAIQNLGLIPATEWLSDEMRRTYGLNVVLSHQGIPKDVDKSMARLVFRTARELLINAAKHAQADEVLLRVAHEGDSLILSVIDDGVGFDTHHALFPSTKGGLGLFSIREEVSYAGGNIQIDSTPGDGTVVVVAIPLSQSTMTH